MRCELLLVLFAIWALTIFWNCIVLNCKLSKLVAPLLSIVLQVLTLLFKSFKFFSYLVLLNREGVVVKAESWAKDSCANQATRATNYVHDAWASKVLVTLLWEPTAAPRPRGDDRKDQHIQHYFEGDLGVDVGSFG